MKYDLWKYDEAYPALLHQIADPPAKLFCQGEKFPADEKYFAIVGTRHPSRYGLEVAAEFATALAKHFVIVSGLAYGIDAAAHRTTLEAGGKTIAVLGSGLNYIVPHCNRNLAKEIEKNGCIVTEYPPETVPQKGYFPARNRIIAGMSIATLIVEGPQRSGSLITARLALEYNREVFAVPGNISHETSAGSNQLIRDSKAMLVTCPEDILTALGIEASATQNKKQPLDLSEKEQKLYALLKASARSINELIHETKLDAHIVGTTLSLLEVKGLITIRGNYVAITR